MVNIVHRSAKFMHRKFGERTKAHISPGGTISLGPDAGKEDLLHEKGHWDMGFSPTEPTSYKKFIKKEIDAWLWADEHKSGKLRTEFVWKVAGDATDYKGATRRGIVEEISKRLKGTPYELSQREKRWLLRQVGFLFHIEGEERKR